jgi:hypothetical protein
MHLQKIFSSFKIFNILFVTVIISSYILNPNNSYSKEEQSNTTPPTTPQEITLNGVKYSPTTPTNNNPQEVTLNGVKYSQTSPQKNINPINPTPPAKTQATQSTLKISDLIVGGYVSAGYLFNLGPTFNSYFSFDYMSGSPNYLHQDIQERISPISKNGDAFYIKLGYQSIMLGLEAELRNNSNLTNEFAINIDHISSIKVYNESPEFGLSFYLDFLKSKKYVLAPIFGITALTSSAKVVYDNITYTDTSLTTSFKYGILYRQFVYKNIGLEISWYGMTRWSSHTHGDYNQAKLDTTYNNSEFSIGIVYDF